MPSLLGIGSSSTASAPFIGANIFTPGYRIDSSLSGNSALTNFGRLDTVPSMEMARRFPSFLSEIDALKSIVAPYKLPSLAALGSQSPRRLGELQNMIASANVDLNRPGADFSFYGGSRAAAEAKLNEWMTEREGILAGLHTGAFDAELVQREGAFGSLMRKAALDQLANAESQTRGNLKEQLARRQLAGASFANDQDVRVAAEFGQQRTQAELAATQQEIALTTQLIDFQNNLIKQQLDRELAELGVASGVGVQMSQAASQNAFANAQLAAAESMARSQSAGSLAGLAGGLALFGGGAGSIFKGADILGTIRGWFGSGAPSVGASGGFQGFTPFSMSQGIG